MDTSRLILTSFISFPGSWFSCLCGTTCLPTRGLSPSRLGISSSGSQLLLSGLRSYSSALNISDPSGASTSDTPSHPSTLYGTPPGP